MLPDDPKLHFLCLCSTDIEGDLDLPLLGTLKS